MDTDTADSKNLSWLMHALPAKGGRLEDDWLGINDLSSNLSNNPVGDVALAQASLSKLKELKSVMQTLNKFSLSIATATATLQRLSEPTIFHHGLSSLPLETLSLIRLWLHVLENGKAYETPEIDSLDFLHRVVLNRSFPLVCRRFREVELSTPELWSTVATNTTFERAKLHIARSGDLPLHVQIISVPYMKELGEGRDFCQCDVLELLASHAHRCEWMDIRLRLRGYSRGGLVWHSDVRNCFNTFDGAHFRKLRRLDVFSVDEATLSTLRTWSMPQLSGIYCDVPAALFALPLSHPLDVLRLSVTHWERLNTNDLIDLLCSPVGSKVQTLGLYLSEVVLDAQSTPRAVLPTLKSVHLHIARGRNIHSLLQRIQAPSVERLEVDIRPNSNHYVDDTIEWISSQRNPNLRNVHVQLHGWEQGEEVIEYARSVHSRIVDGISLDKDSEATLSNLPVVSVGFIPNP